MAAAKSDWITGGEQKVIPLEKPYEGLYVSNAMWREMYDFSPDAVLMVLASELYDEGDYIIVLIYFNIALLQATGGCNP